MARFSLYEPSPQPNGQSMGTAWTALIVVPPALAVSACAANLERVISKRLADNRAIASQSIADLNAASPCCGDYTAITAKQMKLNVKYDVVLNKASPVYEFPFGKSRFQAYEFPALQKGDEIRVYALYIGGPSPKPLYYPAAVLLDKDYKALEHQPEWRFSHSYMGMNSQGHYASIEASTLPTSVHYIVVAADPRYVGQDYVENAYSYMAPAGPVLLNNEVPELRHPYSYEGTSMVQLYRR
jgi:hypothetical protein